VNIERSTGIFLYRGTIKTSAQYNFCRQSCTVRKGFLVKLIERGGFAVEKMLAKFRFKLEQKKPHCQKLTMGLSVF